MLPSQGRWVQEVTCQLAAAVSSLGVLAGTEEDEKECMALFILKNKQQQKTPYFKIYYFNYLF